MELTFFVGRELEREREEEIERRNRKIINSMKSKLYSTLEGDKCYTKNNSD